MYVVRCDFHDFEKGNMKAFAKVTLGDDEGNEITIDGFRIMSGTNGLFAAAPREKGKDDEWRDKVWVPKDNSFKKTFQEQVIALYNEHKGGDPTRTTQQPAVSTSAPQAPGRGNRRVGPPPVGGSR